MILKCLMISSDCKIDPKILKVRTLGEFNKRYKSKHSSDGSQNLKSLFAKVPKKDSPILNGK